MNKAYVFAWKFKALLVFIALVPSFIGYPVVLMDSKWFFSWTFKHLKNLPSDGQVLYLIVSLFLIRFVCGKKIFLFGITAGSFVSFSVVFLGAIVGYVKARFFGFGADVVSELSLYYINRFINIMTVVPLSVSFFLVIPFDDIEHNIITDNIGVSVYKKSVLMISRVVNNIRYSVVPDVFMVISDEKCKKQDDVVSSVLNVDAFRVKLYEEVKKNLYYVAAVIAFSLEYIPVWAYEISSLPNK